MDRGAVAIAILNIALQVAPRTREQARPVEHPIFHRTIQVDGVPRLYRDAPTLLLLHGLPSSSRMFEPLLARLSGSDQLIAPDYLSFGHSEWPDPKELRVHHRS